LPLCRNSLSFYNLEIRDHYFSRLKGKVEHYKQVSGKKTVLVGHSMGGPIILVRPICSESRVSMNRLTRAESCLHQYLCVSGSSSST
jgi:hypothetical protein